MAYSFLPSSISDLVEPFEVPPRQGVFLLGIRDMRLTIMKNTAFLVFLLLTVVSGCSVLSSSESFYRDHPPGRIRWHEYTD
jgi:hypothetical protein